MFRQSNVRAKINDVGCKVLLDTGAEVSIIDYAFARKAGIEIDTGDQLECVGVGGASYHTEGRAKVKITLAEKLVYEFAHWVGPLGQQQAILGMDFMVPAGVRLNLADGSACMPDEVNLQLQGRRSIFSAERQVVELAQDLILRPGETDNIQLRLRERHQLWVSRGSGWVSTVIQSGNGQPMFLRITNISDSDERVKASTTLAVGLSGNKIPREIGFVSLGSRRYREWETLAYENGTNRFVKTGTNSEKEDAAQSQTKTRHRPAIVILKRVQGGELLTPSLSVPSLAANIDQTDHEASNYKHKGATYTTKCRSGKMPAPAVEEDSTKAIGALLRTTGAEYCSGDLAAGALKRFGVFGDTSEAQGGTAERRAKKRLKDKPGGFEDLASVQLARL